MLNLILGITEIDSGKLIFNGKDLTDVPMEKRGFNIVFQDYALFPNLNTYENIVYGLKNNPDRSTKEEVGEMIRLLNLEEHLDKKIEQLSGGQKQRVAIAGIIAMQPECIVLDEPTAMLDPRGRTEVLDTIHKLNRELGITIVLITHYMDEAVTADRVVVMDSGRILTEGTPKEVFSKVELLKQHHLDVPQATELCYRLRACGCQVPLGILDAEECVGILEKLLEAERCPS